MNKANSIGAISQAQFDSLNYSHTIFGCIGPWVTGHPRGNDYGIIELGAYGLDTHLPNGMQEITYTNGDRYYRKAVNGSISRWFKIATATPPEEHDLPLETGFSDPSKYDKSKYWKNQFGEIVCSVNTTAPDIAPTHGMIIATLPPGYRPGYVVQGACAIRLSSGQVISANLAVNTLGAIRIWDVPSGSGAYITKLTGQATFIATH